MTLEDLQIGQSSGVYIKFLRKYWREMSVQIKVMEVEISIWLGNSGQIPNTEVSSVQFSCSVVSDSATPWITARQASLFITNSWSPPKPMSIESVKPSNNLIFCCPLPLLPSTFPSIRVLLNESSLCIRWPKYWSFSFNISPSNEHPGLFSFRMD